MNGALTTDGKGKTFKTDVNCPVCTRLLFKTGPGCLIPIKDPKKEGVVGVVEIKCPSCKSLMDIKGKDFDVFILKTIRGRIVGS